MKIHIIIHESFEAPAAIESWSNFRGYHVSYTKVYEGDPFPANCDFDLLFVMGGPQSPATTIDECPYFDVKNEITFIQKAIKHGKLILGVCLGAQLIGEALDARFDHSPDREIGVFPVMLTEDGRKDPLVGVFPDKFLVGHWHGDMPGLTSEAKILARSEGCPRQIIRYSPNIYGFQCHFEFTPEAIEGMIQNSTHELAEYKDLPYVQTAEQLRANDYTEINKKLFEFLDRFSALLQ